MCSGKTAQTEMYFLDADQEKIQIQGFIDYEYMLSNLSQTQEMQVYLRDQEKDQLEHEKESSFSDVNQNIFDEYYEVVNSS